MTAAENQRGSISMPGFRSSTELLPTFYLWKFLVTPPEIRRQLIFLLNIICSIRNRQPNKPQPIYHANLCHKLHHQQTPDFGGLIFPYGLVEPTVMEAP